MGAIAERIRFEDIALPAAEVFDAPAPEYKLCLILRGEADLSYRCDDRWVTQHVGPGMFAPITRPHEAATMHLSAAQRHLMISVSEVTFDHTLSSAQPCDRSLDRLARGPFRSPFLAQMCRRLYAETLQDDPLSYSSTEVLQPALICTLARCANTKSSCKQRDTKGLSSAMLDKLRRHCLDRIGERISVSSMASLFCMSETQFATRLRNTVDTTPQQFLISLRVEEAKALIKNTSAPLSDIAAQCGFFDQAHMTQTFAKRVAVTPARLRDQRG